MRTLQLSEEEGGSDSDLAVPWWWIQPDSEVCWIKGNSITVDKSVLSLHIKRKSVLHNKTHSVGCYVPFEESLLEQAALLIVVPE
jgi:hypothetical protein